MASHCQRQVLRPLSAPSGDTVLHPRRLQTVEPSAGAAPSTSAQPMAPTQPTQSAWCCCSGSGPDGSATSRDLGRVGEGGLQMDRWTPVFKS